MHECDNICSVCRHPSLKAFLSSLVFQAVLLRLVKCYDGNSWPALIRYKQVEDLTKNDEFLLLEVGAAESKRCLVTARGSFILI